MRQMMGHLYLVATPRPEQPETEFLARVKAALVGGVDMLQLRCKATDPQYGEALPYIRLAEKVGELARATQVPFVVNDRVDVALAVGADGVHLGQNDLPLSVARELGSKLIIGRSTHALEQAKQACEAGTAGLVDYFACGPVYATPTKAGRVPVGLEYLRQVSAVSTVAEVETTLPWYAIGGITLENLPLMIEAGARRVAAVRALLDAADVSEVAAKMRQMLEEASK